MSVNHPVIQAFQTKPLPSDTPSRGTLTSTNLWALTNPFTGIGFTAGN